MSPFTLCRFSLLTPLFFVALCACGQPGPSAVARSGASSAQTDDWPLEVRNLRAFARLYGYIRYFHPSDQASAIDWDGFAMHGVARVKDAATPDELAAALDELFAPIAPSLQILPAGTEPVSLASYLSGETDGLQVVAWQHVGYGFGMMTNGIYQSARTNRARTAAAKGPGFGTVSQGVSAKPYRGRPIRLRAHVRAEVSGTGNQAQLWLRVDRPNRGKGFFENMDKSPITDATWQWYEITGTVDTDAEAIAFGGFLSGTGRAYLDQFELAYRDDSGTWQAIALDNPSFEDSAVQVKSWYAQSPGYDYRVITDNAPHGAHALLITDRKLETHGEQLFEKVPSPTELIRKELDRGLFAAFPVALYSNASGTLPTGRVPLKPLTDAISGVSKDALSASDQRVRLAAVVSAWTVFQHFYPYFDVTDSDWDRALSVALQEALDDTDEQGFLATLQRMVGALRDGHGSVIHTVLYPRRAHLPWQLQAVEGMWVVTRSAAKEAFQVGDVVMAIDGVPIAKLVADTEPRISGSPQWRAARMGRQFGAGQLGTRAEVTLERAGEVLTVTQERTIQGRLPPEDSDAIQVLPGGIYYVDLSRAPMGDINEHIASIAKAPGVVFDLRGYPKGNHYVIRHLLSEADTSDRWMQVPEIIYPDRERVVSWRPHSWLLEPKAPRIAGKVVFITDGRAISYAESFMSFIEHYKLGEIVGAPTAGANGNVNPFNVPGGYRLFWTGMRVHKHDGSQHHLIGVQPTVPLTPTLTGIRAGRDELLERAVQLIKGE